SSHIRFRRRRRYWLFFVNSAHDGNQAETAQFFEIVIRPNLRILAVRLRVRPIGRTQRYGCCNESETDGVIQESSHMCLAYFLEEPGGKFLNIFSTSLSIFLMFLSELLEIVSLELPLQISCFVFASNKSTTKVPTL